MPTWVKVMLALVIPAFAFLVLKDTAGSYYSGGQSRTLSYVVVESEEVAESAVAETEVVAVAPIEEAPVAQADETAINQEIADVVDAEPVLEAEVSVETQLIGVLSTDDMAAAARAARVCASCHQFERERNGAGPHLVGVGGRQVGAVEGFRYSDALVALNAAGAVWTVEELEKWLAGPTAYAPGTKMNFVVQDEAERRLIAQWLVQKDQ